MGGKKSNGFDKLVHKSTKAVSKSAKHTGKAVSKGAKQTGKAVSKGAKQTGKAVSKGVKRTGEVVDSGLRTDVGKASAVAGLEALALATGQPELSLLAPVVMAYGSGGKVSSKVKRAVSTAKPKVNKWVEHVKATAKKHNISYKDAMSVAKETYKR